MPALVLGSSSAPTHLKPMNSSTATISYGRASIALTGRLGASYVSERPAIIFKRRQGPLRLQMGVKSEMTVTRLSP